MSELSKYKLDDFIIKTQDKTSNPGGGAICGLVGALAASLTLMVDNLSKQEALEDPSRVQDLCQRLQDLMQKDAQAFGRVLRAYKLPRESQEEKAHYQEELEKGYQEAIEVPLDICRTLLDLLRIGETMKDKAHKYALSDLKVAASLAYGAMEGAGFMVETNLPGLGQEAQEAYRKTLEAILKEGLEIKEEVNHDA